MWTAPPAPLQMSSDLPRERCTCEFVEVPIPVHTHSPVAYHPLVTIVYSDARTIVEAAGNVLQPIQKNELVRVCKHVYLPVRLCPFNSDVWTLAEGAGALA